MSTQTASRVGTFVWHENVSTDPERAQEFYKQLFGWETEVFKAGEVEYPMISVDGKTHGGFPPVQAGTLPHWAGNVAVEDVDATVDKAKGAGGKLILGPQDIPEVGRFAVLADPQGAVVVLFQSGAKRRRVRASSSGTSSAPRTSRAPSASTTPCSAGRRPTWARSTAATRSSRSERPASVG
jgi:predicted enzyme related to lactoylglutathione lyase